MNLRTVIDRLLGFVSRRPPAAAPSAPGLIRRTYAAAAPARAGALWPVSTSSADQEFASSLTSLRNQARRLVRDAPYAKRAKAIVVNNVIGRGIGLQAKVETTRGNLNDRINDDIERAWRDWSEPARCHTGGSLHFCDFERAAMGQVFEAGEVLIRLHPRAFGDSAVPLALELIEAERLADDWVRPGPVAEGNEVRLGVEIDRFGRPVAYWLRTRHPGDLRWGLDASTQTERVPAEQILHLRIIDRWPQVRGEPWLHSTISKLANMDGYSDAEIVKARAQACDMGIIERPAAVGPVIDPAGEEQDDGSDVIEYAPGMFRKLAPGEKVTFHTPTAPNTALDPFMRYMLREMAAGISGVSYEALSRDFSQTTFSSGRLAVIEDRELWRALQGWWCRSFRKPLHCLWLQQAVLGGAIPSISSEQYWLNPAKFEACLFKLRGWEWFDVAKEVAANEKAIQAGFRTLTDVLAQSGTDLEDYIKTRRRELDLLAAAGIHTTTDTAPPANAPSAPMVDPDEMAPGDAPAKRSAQQIHINVAPVVHVPERALTIEGARIEVPAPVVHMKAPNVHLEAPRIEIAPAQLVVGAPTINVAPPEVRVEPPQVNVAAPDVRVTVEPAQVHVAPAEVRFEPPQVNVAAPEVKVNVEPPQVNVAAPTVNVEAPEVRVAPPVVNVEAPNVTVVQEHADTEQTIDTDAHGNITRVLTKRIGVKR